MVCLRCSKCGSDAGFLIETKDKRVLDVKGRLPLDRVRNSVLVTCTYCNNRWDQVPVRLVVPEALEPAATDKVGPAVVR